MMSRSTKQNRFAEIPKATIPRSVFERSSTVKTAFNHGYLIPIYVDEVLPGDTHTVRGSVFARLATPLKPFFDRLWLDVHWFFVPNRIVWDNWIKMMGEQKNPGDSTDFLLPIVNFPTGVPSGTLFDFMGVPTEAGDTTITSLPGRCYNEIYNEWYRDQDIGPRQTISTGDGPDSVGSFNILARAKKHDYFTSARPWPQKGDAVSVPLGEYAEIGTTLANVEGNTVTIKDFTDGSDRLLNSTGGAGQDEVFVGANQTVDAQLLADLSNATMVTINQLREGFQIQRLLERDARGGTRYTEINRSHFGVSSPDSRVQRPEFLGGGRVFINVSPIAQTAASVIDGTGANGEVAATPQGNLSAMGVGSETNIGFTKSFTEHGYIIGIASAQGETTYQQGLNRMWSRQTRFDFFWPALSRLGEQSILSKEIYHDGSAEDDSVFGYQERFAEYRYRPSVVTGAMRSNSTAPLDFWHLAQDFGARPVLGPSFINEYQPVERVIAVPDEPHYLLDCYISMRSVRPMPLYGVPGYVDHF